MSLNTPTPPLLLTKRLTAFLNANLSPTLHAAFLTTASGKLLAHATSPSFYSSSVSSPGSPTPTASGGSAAATISSPSASPSTSSVSLPTGPRPSSVSLLRTQATVAASLFALHSASATSIPGALPGSSVESHSHLDHDALSGSTAATTGGKKRSTSRLPLTITVQLSNGILVVRRLRCGLLFVCVGPLPDHGDGAAAPPPSHHSGRSTSSAPADGASSAGSGAGGSLGVPGAGQHGHASPAHMPASPSEVDSVMSAGGATTASVASGGSSVAGSAGAAAVVSMRRHAEELARWLDDKLGSLRVPQDGVAVE